jgi:plasmid stabilization system protein ParE
LTAWQLTQAADADLRAIIRYTRDEWGAEQARSYARALEQAIQALADHPQRHRTLPQVHPDVRIARYRQHLIFALPRADRPTLILAILHERMDLITRLAHRLP